MILLEHFELVVFEVFFGGLAAEVEYLDASSPVQEVVVLGLLGRLEAVVGVAALEFGLS